MKRLLIIILIALAAGVIAYRFLATPTVGRFSAAIGDTHKVTVDGAVVWAEFAWTDSERERGLSGRTSLAPDAGMLFIFDTPKQYGFWMKDMRFPLDFIYIRDDAVVALKENVPVASTLITPFVPDQPFTAVLEVNAGWVKQHRIKLDAPVVY